MTSPVNYQSIINLPAEINSEYRIYTVHGYPILLLMREGVAIGQLEGDAVPPLDEEVTVIADGSGTGGAPFFFLTWVDCVQEISDEDKRKAEHAFANALGYPEEVILLHGDLYWDVADSGDVFMGVSVIGETEDDYTTYTLLEYYTESESPLLYLDVRHWELRLPEGIPITSAIKRWGKTVAQQIKDLADYEMPTSEDTIH